MSARPRVAVVFGGRSPEHPISCLTAGTVMAVLDRDRYDVVAVGVTREGRWVVGSGPGEMAPVGADGLPEVTPQPSQQTTPPGQPPAVLGEADVVLPLLHGAYGEDGTVQGLLEVADVRYVGSGVLASAVAMDKSVMKTLLAAAGVPVCRWVTVTRDRWAADPDAVAAEVAQLGWPVFVKPARAGSSFPEQVRGTDVDHRTDIYSFGALLCFMLTGQSPFSAGSQFEAMRAHVYTPAPRLSELAPGCTASPALQDIVAKCLEKEVTDRYQSMSELMQALELLGKEAPRLGGGAASSRSPGQLKLERLRVCRPSDREPRTFEGGLDDSADGRGMRRRARRWAHDLHS